MQILKQHNFSYPQSFQSTSTAPRIQNTSDLAQLSKKKDYTKIQLFQNIKVAGQKHSYTIMEKEVQDYTYFYEQNNSRSLVLLEDYTNVIEEMFKNDMNTFIWVSFQSQIEPQIIEDVEKIVKIKIQRFVNDVDVGQFLGKYAEANQKDLCYFMICQASQKEKIKEFSNIIGNMPIKILLLDSFLCQKSKISSLPKQVRQQRRQQKIQRDLKDQNEQDQIQNINTRESLVQFLQNQKFKLDQKELPNFVSISRGVWQSNMKFRTMSAMINQKIPTQPQKQLIDSMGKLLRKIAESHPIYATGLERIEEFLVDMSENQITRQKALEWYTCESPIYRFTNNLLRSGKSPTQLFYIQPYFRHLFLAVESQFKKFYEKNVQLDEQIVCYRKGIISKKEVYLLQNLKIGDIIQNLGFLSTSLQQDVASGFDGNAKFQIHINFHELNQNDPGFADIKVNSEYYGEAQILFNPLNSFRILSISKQKQGQTSYFDIKLAYGEKQETQNLDESQNQIKQRKQYIKMRRKMRNQARSHVFCQGYALTNDLQALVGSKQYWQKYLVLAQKLKNSEDMVHGLKNLAVCEFSQKNYYEAIILLNRRLQILKSERQTIQQSLSDENYRSESIRRLQSQTYNFMGNIYTQRGDYKAAIQIYNQSRQIIFQIDGQMNLSFAQICKNMGNVYQYQGYLQYALAFYNKAIEITKKVNIQKHPQQASLLQSIGLVYYKLRRYQLGLKYLEESKKISLGILGENSDQYFQVLRAIANILRNLRRFREALKFYDQLRNLKMPLSMQKDVEKEIQTDIATVYLQEGNAEKSLELLLKFKDYTISMQGLGYRKIASSLSLMALTHQNIGNYLLAQQYYVKAKNIVHKIEGTQSKWYKQLEWQNDLNVLSQIFDFLPIFRVKSQISSIRYHKQLKTFKNPRKNGCKKSNINTKRQNQYKMFKNRIIQVKKKIIQIQRIKNKAKNYMDFRMIDL